MEDELLAVIGADGTPTNQSVNRSEAHRLGIWHRSISVFVINRYGEILIEQRSEFKDLFPGCRDIVGGHLEYGQSPINCARKEIAEEISIDVPDERLEPLCRDDQLVEQVVIPEKNIINFERKTIYALKINSEEERQILKHAGELSKLPEGELKKLGSRGEVSHIEFWSMERLLQTQQPDAPYKLASGTYSALADTGVRKKIHEICRNTRAQRRISFRKRHSLFNHFNSQEKKFDNDLLEFFVEEPSEKAHHTVVSEIFENGPKQQAGAYLVGEMRNLFGAEPHWEEKYNDPKDRYVDNLLAAISYGVGKKEKDYLQKIKPDIKQFVSELLELPLTNGSRFRDAFGNLVDIWVARNAVLKWLEYNTDLIDKNKLAYPTQSITVHSLQAGEQLFVQRTNELPNRGLERLRALVNMGLDASPTDFNNPTFQSHLQTAANGFSIIEFLNANDVQDLAAELGGDSFLIDFYNRYISASPSVKIAYLPGTASQAAFSLAICQELLSQNPNSEIDFIPKTGHPGNDLSYDEAILLFERMYRVHLKKLLTYQKRRRFRILDKGSRTHGLDPSRMHKSTAQALSSADVIVAEGQAYAEIRCWKKPVYIAFRVNGRIAKAIHGDALIGKTGFVRLTPGVEHFNVFDSPVSSPSNKVVFAKYTTSEYVRAILHQNLDLIIQKLFLNDWSTAIDKIKEEAGRLNKSLPEIIIGNASQLPSDVAVRQYKERRYTVFACGGGGGFSAVTLRAMRQLGIPTIAGLPSSDDGGSTGELQLELRPSRGFVFGVGDLAAIIQDSLNNKGKKAILSYRFVDDSLSTVQGVMKRIVNEVKSANSSFSAADDLLSFVCDQLNLARIIDQKFRSGQNNCITLEGASIRNLNVIAAFELCGALGDATEISDDQRIAALIVLEKALALPETLTAIPVTYEECILYVDYVEPISDANLSKLPPEACDTVKNRVYGQQHIDKLPQPGKRRMVGIKGRNDKVPNVNQEYIRRLRDAELIIVGAGSLISSQLSQIALPGVVDELLKAQSKRRILVLNHVKMDETLEMTVSDHVRLIEDVGLKMSTSSVRRKFTEHLTKLRISDLFSDIVVPRTVARELEEAMGAYGYEWEKKPLDSFEFVKIPFVAGQNFEKIYRNKYVDFLEKHPEIAEKYQITPREIEILSFLDQPAELYKERSEKGRYRGALFATDQDIDYLTRQGIQRRNIHEVDAIGKNIKFIKSKGNTQFEYFPGLIPQSLMGIFQLALEKGMARSRIFEL